VNNCANIFVCLSDYFFRINSYKWNCPNNNFSSEKEIKQSHLQLNQNSNNEVLGNAQIELGLNIWGILNFIILNFCKYALRTQ